MLIDVAFAKFALFLDTILFCLLLLTFWNFLVVVNWQTIGKIQIRIYSF